MNARRGPGSLSSITPQLCPTRVRLLAAAAVCNRRRAVSEREAKELNAMLAEQARTNGAKLIDWYKAGIGHDACQGPLVRWVEPWIPLNLAAPLHPNLRGMRGASGLLAAALR